MANTVASTEAATLLPEQVRARYKQLLQDMAAAAVTLGQLADDEGRFRHVLQNRGLLGKIEEMPLSAARLDLPSRTNTWLDSLNDRYGVTTTEPRVIGGPRILSPDAPTPFR